MHVRATVPVIWDRDVEDVEGTVAASVINEAVTKARDAFWQSIAESFPQATSGDLAPGEADSFTWATNDVVHRWLVNNV